MSSNLSKPTIYLFLLSFFYLSSFPDLTLASRKLSSIYRPPPTILTYHGGALLDGHVPISILWYGNFSYAQRSIISTLIHSLTPPHHPTTFADTTPTVSRWWRTVDAYLQKAGKSRNTHVLLANQVMDTDYTMGKFLDRSGIAELATRYLRAVHGGGLALVLTDKDVAVEGFCSSMCGLHGSVRGHERFAFVWVGDSTSQCPGQCAWPFHEPVYGPNEPGLVPPNGDVGMDGMVISLATSVAGAVTNPFGDGYFAAAGTEVAAACPGVYGKGAYPGYPGQLRTDWKTKGRYNVEGEDGKKYLLPVLLDPISHSCVLMD